MNILVIANDKELANYLELEEGRYKFNYITDGEVGLKVAMQKQFDLIVLDWMLPCQDGLSILKGLREQKILTPILMLVPEDSVKDVIMSLDSGANDCLTKPFENHVLIARMKALIRRSKWDLCAEVRHEHRCLNPVISILIEDDDEFSRATLARLLAIKLPEVVVHATDSDMSRLELCTQHNIDIVITDIKKPSMDIRNIIEPIRSVKHNTKFIVITGTSEQSELNKISQMDNVTLIRKPVDLGRLLVAIKCIISDIC